MKPLPQTQNRKESLALIVNPKSAGGRTAGKTKRLAVEAARWFKKVALFETRAPRHAEQLARDAAAAGFHVVAAVGGDGTASEVVNGLVPTGQSPTPDVVFTVIPAGTGSDLIKTIGIPKDLSKALQTAAHGETRWSDVIVVQMTCAETGHLIHRVSINMTGFCSNGDVVAYANQSSKRFGGTATFLWASLRVAATYDPPRVRLDWVSEAGERHTLDKELLSVNLANGEYGGGGMWLGRGGSMQSGLMKMTLIPPLGVLKMGRCIPKLYRGTAGTLNDVVEAQILSLNATSLVQRPVRIDVDGEQPGILPAIFSLRPKCLKVRGLW
jgi:diacylglycerol kinase (ATP)